MRQIASNYENSGKGKGKERRKKKDAKAKRDAIQKGAGGHAFEDDGSFMAKAKALAEAKEYRNEYGRTHAVQGLCAAPLARRWSHRESRAPAALISYTFFV